MTKHGLNQNQSNRRFRSCAGLRTTDAQLKLPRSYNHRSTQLLIFLTPAISFFLLLSLGIIELPLLKTSYTLIMDTLVARYSQPSIGYGGYSQQEQDELTETTPPLSLKFALPPIANVSPLRLSFFQMHHTPLRFV